MKPRHPKVVKSAVWRPLKCLPVLQHSAGYIFISLVSLNILVILKIGYHVRRCQQCVSSLPNYIAPYEDLIKLSLRFSSFCVFFVSKLKLLDLYCFKHIINPYKPSVPQKRHKKTVQTQIIHRRRRRLIRVYTVCIMFSYFYKT